MNIEILEQFSEDLKEKFALPGQASPEDQLKPLVADLFTQAGKTISLKVESRTETHLSELKVRPDIAIYVGGLICGYIELKAPGLGADAPKLKGKHNKAQWAKLKSLPNLIYSDGREWALYRSGVRQGPIVRFDDDPVDVGKKAVSQDNADALSKVIQPFLGWKPVVPHKPSPLAEYLAPFTRFLRSEVEAALARPESDISALASEWRSFFFPTADDAQFADAYAQTVTYAMLLARLSGAEKLDPIEAAKTLDNGNRLLARALELLGQKDAREELRVGFELLQRSLESLDPHDFMKSKPDLWLYFYEDFLAAYDPKLRRDYGVYYTPREVVELQVRLVSELLETRFDKKLGFADDGVVFLDPAVGTGTYPVAAIRHALEKVSARSGEGAVAGRASQMAQNMYGFEVLVGPYAVAHLRLTQALEGSGATMPERLKIYLADTLGSPNEAPPGGLDLTHRVLTQEHEAARKVKNEGDILVCLGNPPYDRQNIDEGDTSTKRKGGWVRFGDQIEGGAKAEEQGEEPILEDFLEPARLAGQGVHLKNLYNDYVYFWRWTLWRMFEQQACGGIVSFITASSYLAGPGFLGMRKMMRQTFDELWIIDLGGDNIGARKTPNVFNIQTPVAVSVGVRSKNGSSEKPAQVKYAKVSAADRDSKLKQLASRLQFEDLTWRTCSDDWEAPFLPVGQGDYFSWCKLTDIFPWSHTGSQFQRTWPIAETSEVLKNRWNALLTAETDQSKSKLFKKSRDRDPFYQSKDKSTGPTIGSLEADSKMPAPDGYGFRSFDRHVALLDYRLGDYLRPPLLETRSKTQVYLTSLITEQLGNGQGIMASAFVPDLNYFHGRHGMVMPLYRDGEGLEPNLTPGLLEKLGETYDEEVTAEELTGYIYAVLGGQSYTGRFWNELETPGPRVPITKDKNGFRRGVDLGKRLIWLHTYAERFLGDDRGDVVPKGSATSIKGVSSDPANYPEDFAYDSEKKEIRIGDGFFGPVATEIWDFEVSGLKVVQSWLAYRMKERAGRKSSPLDDIRPDLWTPRMTDEFLELLWVLEETLAMEPDLSSLLDEIVAGECFLAKDLPKPTEAERKAPEVKSENDDQMSLI